jgi:iron complex transport system ATP-binding protein
MLECRNLSFSYNGREEVLKNITLSFAPGRFYGIFGPNGSGKSTLLKLLTGELKSSSGSVSPQWDSPLIRARNIALVEQQIPSSLPLTVAETAALGRFPWEKKNAVCHEKVEQVLEELELSSLRERPFNALSGGEQQRVMLARALVQDTQVLCLDEPGSSLDIGFQHALCRILKKLAGQGKCVIMISHDLFSAPAYLDRMILLDQGTLAADDEPEKLRNSQLLREVFNLPSEKI